MSNKTAFKRVALAVVAALGFGMLSVAPSSATVIGLTVTSTAGAASTIKSDSSTTGTLSISYTMSQTNDSVVVTTFAQNAPTGASAITNENWKFRLKDTTTSTGVVSVVPYLADTAGTAVLAGATGAVLESDSTIVITKGSAAGTVAVNLSAYIDTAAALNPIADLKAATYTLNVIITPYNNGVAGTPVTGSVSMVVEKTAATLAQESKVIDSTKTIAILSNVANWGATTTTADSSLAFISTAAVTDHATILVRTFNAESVATTESVTATISTAGVLCNGGVCGSSLTLTGSSGVETITVRADGRAGVAKIDIKTTSKTFASKSLTFFATNPATYTPSLDVPVIGVGTTDDVVSIAAVDENGNVWGGTNLYLYSSDTSIARDATCTFLAADLVHYCPVVGVKAGETKWYIGNKATRDLSTVKSSEFAGPRVTAEVASSVKIEFDKAAYAPGEKARIYVTPLDAAGKALAGGTINDLLASGGITTTVAFSSGSDTLTAASLTIASSSSSTSGAKAGSKMYTVYMPFGKGTVTLSATGGAGLPVAARVALTASAEVVDDSVDAAVDAAQEATDAAIAATDAAILAQEAADEAASAAIAAQETAQAAVDAVTALSAEVTKLVAQLATLQKLLNRVAKRVGVKL